MGQESGLGDMICHDNCPYYELPNVFTPNEDGEIDVFKTFDESKSKCARFVKSVIFKLYNRDGCNSMGKPLPKGVYFYISEVQFHALDPALSTNTYKGWVSLMK